MVIEVRKISSTQLDDGVNKKLLDFVSGFKIGGKSE